MLIPKRLEATISSETGAVGLSDPEARQLKSTKYVTTKYRKSQGISKLFGWCEIGTNEKGENSLIKARRDEVPRDGLLSK